MARHLAVFSGILQADDYSSYTNLAKTRAKTDSKKRSSSQCLAHLRHKPCDLHKQRQAKPRSQISYLTKLVSLACPGVLRVGKSVRVHANAHLIRSRFHDFCARQAFTEESGEKKYKCDAQCV